MLKIFFGNLEAGNWVSLICSAISVVISITLGIWNLINTNRQFVAAFYSKLSVDLLNKECEFGTSPQIVVKNLSKDKTVIDGVVSLRVMSPIKSFSYFFRKPLSILDVKELSLGPGEEKRLVDSIENKHKSLEQILLAEYPKYIKTLKVGNTLDEYYVQHTKSLVFKVYIKYQSGFTGSKYSKFYKIFSFKPICVGRKYEKYWLLSYWEKIIN